MFKLPSDPAEPSAACPRGTVPVWREEMPVFERATIDRDLNADVRVVGAGIAGLTAAYLPAKGGNSVIGSPPAPAAQDRRDAPDRGAAHPP